jgi:aminoglycoside 3-N-acetyltransferase
MSEKIAIEKMKMPNTVSTLEADFRKLGLKEGMIVIVQSSLSAIGWVCGGEQAVIQALMNVLTESGTLVMPAHSGGLSDPSHWENPPVPESWWQIIRAEMPAFDPKTTPTRGMGKIAESFLSFPDVKRSNHPQVSFSAWGRHADAIIVNHQLDFGCGAGSPLQKAYELNGHILLLGVGYGNNTSLHLSEYHSGHLSPVKQGAPIMENGVRVWREFEDTWGNDEDFPRLGAEFEQEFKVQTRNIGSAESRLMNQRELVDFGIKWFMK